MSGLASNQDIEFEEQITMISRYRDPYGNLWGIEMTGKAKIVRELAKERPIVIKAIPLGREKDDEDWLRSEEIFAKFSGKSEDYLRYDPDYSPDIDDSLDLTPELFVKVSLASPLDTEKYVFHIEFDPSIYETSNPHRYVFSLSSKVTDFRIAVSTEQGNVSHTSHYSDGGRTGNATIRWTDGNPAKYTITSHAGRRVD
jgi:hypothetical protein